MKTIEITLPQPVLFVLERLTSAGFEAYVVGGAVRDILRGQETQDWDITTKASPEQTQPLFNGSFYDNQFGTVMIPAKALFDQMRQSGWVTAETLIESEEWEGQVIDITTFRIERGYTDRRRPDQVSWGQTLAEDLSRRDFTINAMALGPVKNTLMNLAAFIRHNPETKVEMELIDPFEGESDLKKQIIRAVGLPPERFNEDALRMMRAIRFGAQLGMTIEAKTLAAIQESAPLIQQVSWERIRDEWMKILASPYPSDGVILMMAGGLLKHVIPELLETRGVIQGGHHIYDVWTHSLMALKECAASDPIVRLATLLHDIGKPKTMRRQGPRGVTFYGHEVVGAHMAKVIGQRLKLSRKQIDKLYTLVRWHMFVYDSGMTDAAIRRFIKRVGLENINDMMLLRVGDRKGGGSRATSWRLRELQERIGAQMYTPLSLKDLKINGTQVMTNLNISPGPEVGRILNLLFEEVMEDPQKNDQEYLNRRAKELFKP